MNDIRYYIAHAEWSPERRRSLDRLIDSLGKGGVPSAHIVASAQKEHAKIWARKLWMKVAADDAETAVCLNDDITVPEHFHEAIVALTQVVKRHPLSLHTQGSVDILRAARDGARFVAFHCMTGPGYALRRGHAASLLEYWDTHAEELEYAPNNEDGIGARWSYANGILFVGTIPALVEHDVSVPSTLGYDKHPMRKAGVPFGEDRGLAHASDLTNRVAPYDLRSWPSLATASDVERNLPHVENPWFPISQMLALQEAGKVSA
jgi:hypothetical protein